MGNEGKSRKVGVQREKAGRNESNLGLVIVGGREQDRLKTGRQHFRTSLAREVDVNVCRSVPR